ncbi:clotting factor G beta subunit-like isoform X17 [Diabrotica undecimpunctata]|uniref:clotting factor G beta subunit-like isoform X17 n=1 Tax=Diabrotica undecimpunctata TaxID=50387 RepID=UPI003B63C5D4
MFVIFIILAFASHSQGTYQACCIAGLQGICLPARVCGSVYKLDANSYIEYCQPEGPELYICCPNVLTAFNKDPLYFSMQGDGQNITLPKKTLSSTEHPISVSVKSIIDSSTSTEDLMSSAMKYDILKSTPSQDMPYGRTESPAPELPDAPRELDEDLSSVSIKMCQQYNLNSMDSFRFRREQGAHTSLGGFRSPPNEFRHMGISPILSSIDSSDPWSISPVLSSIDSFYPKAPQALYGIISPPKKFPHMALIGFGPEENKKWLCCGSVISVNFVLTAAHCLNSDYGAAKWVHLGDLDLSTDQDDAEPQDFNITRAIAYPSYNSSFKYHDIALIQLDRNIRVSSYVKIACLQTVKKMYYGRDGSMTAVGWGVTEYAGEQNNLLLYININEVSTEECSNSYSNYKSTLPHGIDGDTMICAGGKNRIDTCVGDSGGPLQDSYGVGIKIVGITSFGKPCGLTESPSVYTRVSYYVDWIERIVWPEEYQKAHP